MNSAAPCLLEMDSNGALDLVRAFQIAGAQAGTSINIQGTPDDPLFQANQIGALLGIVNIRETMHGFDEDEKTKGVSTADTKTGGAQTVIFLTEIGLYRLLGMSRKPIARPFQKWVAGVVRELRLHAKRQLEIGLNDVQAQLVSSSQLVSITASKAAKLARHVALISSNLNTTCGYVGIVLEIDDVSFVFKIGETDDIKTRSAGLKAQYGMFVLLDVFPCVQAHRFEQNVIHTPQFIGRKYTGTVNGHNGKELFLVDATWPYEAIVRALLSKKVEEFNGTREQFMELQRLKVRELELKVQERQVKVRELEAQTRNLIIEAATQEQRVGLVQLIYGKSERNTSPAPSFADTSEDVFPEYTTVHDDTVSVMDAPSFNDRDNAPDGPHPFLMHKTCDKRIQQYDEVDLTRLIATHNGIREAARAVHGAKDSSIRTACTLNEAYMCFRWFAIARDDPLGPDVARDIPPTAPPNRRTGRVAQISIDKTCIVAVHHNQIRAAAAVGLRNSSSITNAQRFNTPAAGHWWALYADCNSELLATFDSTNVDDDASQHHARGRRVQQIEPSTDKVLCEHASMTVVCRYFQASHKYIHRASQDNSIYKNFRWKLVD